MLKEAAFSPKSEKCSANLILGVDLILYLYVLRDFIKYVIGTLVLCTFLFILFDFIHRSTKYFAEHKAETRYIVEFYLTQIPQQMIQVLPIASLLSGMVVMVLLSRTNEITAMRACGMGPFRIAAPVISGGLLLSVAAFFFGEFVAPYASARMHYVQDVLIEGSKADEARTNASWRRIDNSLFHFSNYDPTAKILHGVTITSLDSRHRTSRIDFIRKAQFNEDNGKWNAENIVTRSFTDDGHLGSLTKKDKLEMLLPFEVEKLVKERRKTEELSLAEMKTDVKRGRRAGLDVATLYLDMHAKFAFYFASLFVSILGLRFAYRSERNVETARGVLLAIGIGISYWFILNAFKAVGKRGILPPMLAAWGANFCMMLAGAYEFYKAKKA